MDSSDDGGGCLHRLSFGNEAGEELGLQTLSTGQCAPDAHRLQNIHRTLKPGLSSQFNLHGTHAKRDKEIDAHYEKTPKTDVITTDIRRTFYLSEMSFFYQQWS